MNYPRHAHRRIPAKEFYQILLQHVVFMIPVAQEATFKVRFSERKRCISDVPMSFLLRVFCSTFAVMAILLLFHSDIKLGERKIIQIIRQRDIGIICSYHCTHLRTCNVASRCTYRMSYCRSVNHRLIGVFC